MLAPPLLTLLAPLLTLLAQPTVAVPQPAAIGVPRVLPHPISSPPTLNASNHLNDDQTFDFLTDEEINQHEQGLSALLQPQAFAPQAACSAGQTSVITIPVYIHNFWFENIAGGNLCCPNKYWYVEPKDMKASIALLNKHFSLYKPRFKFTLMGTTWKKYKREEEWAKDAHLVLPLGAKGKAQINRLATYARGPASSRPASAARQLHIYIARVDNALAFSFRPSTPVASYDGVYINHFFMQATFAPYTTLTHEVGHWLGLFHTFEAPAGKDPCLEPNDATHGDRLVDTPRWSDKGPETSRDCYDWSLVKPACPGKYTLADIKKSVGNFLSYSYYACRKSFTTGQLNKMYQTATLIRKFKPTCATLS